MNRTKSADPRRRMGVFKSLGDVPERRRFYQFAAAYEPRDVWTEFVAVERERFTSDRFRQNIERAGRRWKEHMADRGRHHALATPADVESWSATLLDEYAVEYAYNTLWVRVEAFYDWLQNHVDHPHTYHPVLMAAADCPATGEIWDAKIGRWDGD